MKRTIVLLFTLVCISFIVVAQQNMYNGTLSLAGIESEKDLYYSANTLKVLVNPNGDAVATINFKLSSKKDPIGYMLFVGTLNGSFINSVFTAKGILTQTLKDGKHSESANVSSELKGTGNGNKVNGTLTLIVDGVRQSDISFSFSTAELAPELMFPLGESPKVFNVGWLFGARFIITTEKGEELDLSDKVEWSGTAKFESTTGASNRPDFNSVGANNLILTVLHNGKEFKKEYPIITVDANEYARLGSIAACPADAHGGPADPMSTHGHIITGNKNVFIKGLPAACEGDLGIHAACAGANRFEVAGGDPEVLINGKMAAKLNTPTRHCGGMGKIVELLPEKAPYFLMPVYKLKSESEMAADREALKKKRKIETGKKGMLIMNPDRQTIVTLLPDSKATVTEASGENLFIELTEGSLMVNSHKTDSNKNLVVETEQEKLIRKGTRYLFTHTANSSKLIVYEGAVEVHLKKDNSVILVPAGKSYTNDFTSPYIIKDTLAFESASILQTIPKDSLQFVFDNDLESKDPAGIKSDSSFINLLKKYWYVGAAFFVLISIVILSRKRKK